MYLLVLAISTKSLHSCLALCDPMDCSLPGSSVHGILQAPITGVGCCALLQGIFPTQRLNPCLLQLPHCRQILYCWASGKPVLVHMTLYKQWICAVWLHHWPLMWKRMEGSSCCAPWSLQWADLPLSCWQHSRQLMIMGKHLTYVFRESCTTGKSSWKWWEWGPVQADSTQSKSCSWGRLWG